MILKKIAFITAFTFSLCLFSQTEKGKFFIGLNSTLNLNIDSDKVEGNTFSRDASSSTSISVSPNIGYAIKSNFFIGLSISYQYDHENNTDYGYEFYQNSVLFSPFLKCYFTENKIRPFLSGSYGVGFLRDKTRFSLTTNTFDSVKGGLSALNLGGGLSYFFNEYINIELSLNYLRSASDEDNPLNETYITHRFNSNIGFSIFL